MGKLVRDRIPDIIRAEGRTAQARVLNDGDYRGALLDKLVEESQELRDAAPDTALEEAADVYEVLLALAAHEGWTIEQIARRAEAKRDERGGFEARLYLECFTSAGLEERS